MLGRDGENFVAQFVKLRGHFGLLRHVNFIYREDGRLAGAAKEEGEFFVERSGAGATVHNLDDAGCVFDGDASLAQNFSGDAGFVFGDDSAGVNDLKGAAFPVCGAVDAVAGDAGLVGDNGAARAGEAIEERGLAHVGASDDYDGWQFFGH